MVPKDLFDRYDAALGANAALMRLAVTELVAQVAGGADLHQLYAALVAEFGRYAAAAAVEFYQSCRDSSGVPTPYEAVMYDLDDSDALAGDVARALASGAQLDRLAQRVDASARRRVMERADEVLLRNAQRDPAHPKWALVPHPGACAWCRFLGSQDFVYNKRATALAARHDNCLCTPVVDFDVENPHLDGYDPDRYFGEYADARAEVEQEARDEWAAMSAEERGKYAQKGRGAYDHFLRNKIVGRMAQGAQDE